MEAIMKKHTQPGLFDVAAQCSAEALDKIDVERLRGLVEFEYLQLINGATADEIVERLQKRGHKVDEFAIRPRVTELKSKYCLLYATGVRKKNKKGNTCAVLRHVNFRKETPNV
jgi:hypothetical protein